VIALKQYFNLCRGSGFKGFVSKKISSISPGERTFQFQIKTFSAEDFKIIRVVLFMV
jgi:hypothetical protein